MGFVEWGDQIVRVESPEEVASRRWNETTLMGFYYGVLEALRPENYVSKLRKISTIDLAVGGLMVAGALLTKIERESRKPLISMAGGLTGALLFYINARIICSQIPVEIGKDAYRFIIGAGIAAGIFGASIIDQRSTTPKR